MIIFDVITTTKNSSASIESTLSSVSSQTYEHINHIIIDGYSSDSTIDIVNHYNHCKNLSIFQEDPLGIANAFNKGLLKSSGDLILFLNSGDRFVDENVVKQLVESYMNNIWLWAFGETISVSRRGYVKRHIKQYKKWDQRLFLYSNPICHQSTIFSQELINKVGLYNEQLSLEMDYDFNVRASLISHPYLLYFPVSYYDTTGVSSIQVFKHYEIHKKLRKKYFPLSHMKNLMIDSIYYILAMKRFLMIPIKLYL
jgi:glycosyltransferase involved in cell wall biosynthesis